MNTPSTVHGSEGAEGKSHGTTRVKLRYGSEEQRLLTMFYCQDLHLTDTPQSIHHYIHPEP